MPKIVVRLVASACVAFVAACALSGCGRYPDLPEPGGEPSPEGPMWNPETLTIVSCDDVPPVPKDEQVQVAESSPGGPGQTAILTWVDDSGSDSETRQYMVRVHDPACANRPDIRVWLGHQGRPPRFENAHIVVRPGQARAYVGYTIVGLGKNQYATPDEVQGVSSGGRPVRWMHQTETGGPGDITATAGRRVVPPGSPESGDADYVDASRVKVGQTVAFIFYFETGGVKVPFKVVAAK